MSRSFLKILVFLLACRAGWAQHTGGAVLVGLDLSKNVPALPFLKNYKYFFDRGFLVEMPVYVPIRTTRLFVRVTPGYASIAANPIYRNLDYHNQGFLLKVGVDYFPIRNFSLGGGLNAAAYDEFRQYVLPGPFFGDLRVPFRRRIFGLGLEGRYASYFFIDRRFFISPEIRFVIHSVITPEAMDSYYIPGMGATDRDLPITGGFSVRLGYAFRLRP